MVDCIWTIPSCELKSALIEKVESRGEIYINLLTKLEEFNTYISQELRQINELFPEYTPHDSYYHIKNLFRVADTLIGKERYELMNASELYILSLSLYAHDWGMAVSKSEMHFIATGEKEDGIDFNLLNDEQSRFTEFLKKNKVFKNIKDENDIDIALWRNYIRETHALRSGVRVYSHFENIDGGIADAVSKICVGHWENIEEITEEKGFYMDTSILGENINLKALTVYVRIIDLFDLSEDRTPYVIWKYINPQDNASKMEWKKHRALRPITCPKYESGRVICISGSTDDHNVYAALEDLRLICEKYFRECTSVLARMNDLRHRLDIYYIDWRVEARGFKPISMQFEFDRDKIFGILSSNIYNNNPYSFLRELLQNSIDAIQARKSLLLHKKAGGDTVGLISVNVEHLENGDSVITWNDDGIGMDEYILKNYFSTLGKSYYSSKDFNNEELKIDPISKFGIGVLSCFMVADKIEIDTYHDPNMYPPALPLHVIIPDMRLQFRVETLSAYNASVGTTIKVYVNGKKFKESGEKEKEFNVTSYLCYIAGFVRYPILINENHKRTIILSPKYDIKELDKFLEDLKGYDIYKLSYGYPISKVFWPQDQELVTKVYNQRTYDIKQDLAVDAYEGIITLLEFKNEKTDVIGKDHRWPSSDIELIENGLPTKKRIRWDFDWNRFCTNKYNYQNNYVNSFRVYNDGVLVEKEYPFINHIDKENRISYPAFDEDDFHAFGVIPMVLINIPNEIKGELSLARTEMKSKVQYWENILNGYAKFFYRIIEKYINELDPLECLFKTASIITFNRITLVNFLKSKYSEGIKMPFISDNGVVIFEELNDKVVYITPKLFSKEIVNILRSMLSGVSNKVEKWEFAKSLVYINPEYDEMEAVLKQMLIISTTMIRLKYSLKSIEFLNLTKGKIIVHEKWIQTSKKSKTINFNELYQSIKKNCYIIDELQNELLKSNKSFNRMPNFVTFSSPYENHIAYGYDYFNINHPFVLEIVKYTVEALRVKENNLLDDKQIGILFDLFRNLPFFDNTYLFENQSIDSINKSLKNIKIMLEDNGVISRSDGSNSVIITKDSFVPSSIKHVSPGNLICFQK